MGPLPKGWLLGDGNSKAPDQEGDDSADKEMRTGKVEKQQRQEKRGKTKKSSISPPKSLILALNLLWTAPPVLGGHPSLLAWSPCSLGTGLRTAT